MRYREKEIARGRAKIGAVGRSGSGADRSDCTRTLSMAGTGIRATLLVALSEQRNSPEAMCFQPDAADADVAATFPDSPPPPPPPHEQQQHLEPSPSPSSPEGSTPSSQPSPSAPSNRRKVMAMSASVSLRALQHLPIPLLVLDARKTIVLANDALGEYLGFSAREGDRGSGGGGDGGGDARYIEVTEQLLGMPLKQLGIDAFAKDATLCLLSWEAQLDLLTREVGPDGKFKTERIDVHVPLRGAQVSWGQGPPGPARRTQLTISPWKDEGRVFFTCTFKTLPSKRLSRPSEGERDEWPAKNYTLVSEVSESKSDRTETSDERTAATLMEKIEVLEEALIDAMETPVIAVSQPPRILVVTCARANTLVDVLRDCRCTTTAASHYRTGHAASSSSHRTRPRTPAKSHGRSIACSHGTTLKSIPLTFRASCGPTSCRCFR